MTWKPVMLRLCERFDFIAPDLRGFGDSDKPAGDFGPSDHVLDVVALIEALVLAWSASCPTTWARQLPKRSHVPVPIL